MFKSKLFATLALVLAAVAILSTMTLARTAFAAGKTGGDVFVDEGDGDFDAMPAPPTPQEAVVPVAKDVPETSLVASPKEEAPPEIPQEEAISALADDSAAPVAPVPTEDSSQPPAAQPKEKKSKKKKSPAKKAAASASNDDVAPVAPKGSFVTTKEACPMLRSPASTGEEMLTVKASKKIWVEDAGKGWVKAFNKAGEPGYVSKDCVQ